MASKDPKMSKLGAASKRNHITLMILQKLEIIVRPESCLISLNQQMKDVSSD
jgi:hypothetical protein